MKISRILAGAGALAMSLVLAACGSLGSAGDSNSDDPIRIGGTLALTGPLAATGEIHKLAGEQYVEWLNENGGLLAARSSGCCSTTSPTRRPRPTATTA